MRNDHFSGGRGSARSVEGSKTVLSPYELIIKIMFIIEIMRKIMMKPALNFY